LNLEYLKRLQSSEPLHTKIHSSYFFGRRIVWAQTAIFFAKTGLQKCGRVNNCSLENGSLVEYLKNIPQSEQNTAALDGFFHQIKVRQPIGRQDSIQSSKKQGVGGIFARRGSERLFKYSRSN
jgi:hypothetical protein